MIRSIPKAVLNLLIINVILYIASRSIGDLSQLLGLRYPQNPEFGYWQVITHLFMHGNFMHLLFNMLILWMFGSTMEREWGTNKFLFFYFSSGLGAAAIQLLYYYLQINHLSTLLTDLSPFEIQQGLENKEFPRALVDAHLMTVSKAVEAFHVTMVGASGALYGVLAAFAFTFPNARLMLLFPPIPIKAKYLVPGLIVIDMVGAFSSYGIGSVAHFAHLGGALTGVLIMLYWRKLNK
ncbi:MAG: rhomboid family intramembrane serine protease [Flavobacteriaceae bacterium]|nr:rhomboid family intramembrane serine protease [Flavobacteriaceae bacterium]MCY4266380.1 rhomboid family intramembrane serine protease [Flavobacteriaceae bacterium]MCY4298712.1 rhomboid family intramembrane serine protease [Flavobacteriaceae bacterium]